MKNILWIFRIALMAFIVFPTPLFAADVNFTVTQDGIDVSLDPKSKIINVVEGTISVNASESGSIDIDIENGNSMLTLWPVAPKYDSEKGLISFTGGIPLGTKSEGLLFRVRVKSSGHSASGEKGNENGIGGITFAWAGGTAYLNDGKGTKESISSKPLTIHMSGIAEVSSAKHEDSETATTSADLPGSDGLNNVTILLSSIIVLVVLFYAYKKIVRKKAAL